MSTYVSESLNINYSVPTGLVFMLAGITNKPHKEVWCELSSIANICASRLTKKKYQQHSWTTKKFPGTDVELRIDMRKNYRYGDNKKDSFTCEVKFGRAKFERFTQEQVNEYITESILLGANEDEQVQDDVPASE